MAQDDSSAPNVVAFATLTFRDACIVQWLQKHDSESKFDAVLTDEIGLCQAATWKKQLCADLRATASADNHEDGSTVSLHRTGEDEDVPEMPADIASR